MYFSRALVSSVIRAREVPGLNPRPDQGEHAAYAMTSANG